MQQNYKYLIFDADHTLIDYTADERAALSRLYKEIGLCVTDELLNFSHRLSETVWTEAGLYDVNSPYIQREYHNLYRSHVTGIFQRVFEKYPCSADPKTVGEKFLLYLEAVGEFMPHAEEILRLFSKKTGGRYEIIVATNGICPIQKGRLTRVRPYVNEVYISEALGVIKPIPAFFEKILVDLKADKNECLMIGDSLSSDMAGARAVGIDCCWYNPLGKANNSDVSPDYIVQSLEELKNIL